MIPKDAREIEQRKNIKENTRTIVWNDMIIIRVKKNKIDGDDRICAKKAHETK
jgi:hypothetical protein